MTRPMLLWLMFVLVAVYLVCIPLLLRAETLHAFCDGGWCLMTEQDFNALHALAQKVGKTCT